MVLGWTPTAKQGDALKGRGMSDQLEPTEGRSVSASVSVSYAEYVAILIVVCVLVLGVMILLAPAIAHLLAGLFPHLFAT